MCKPKNNDEYKILIHLVKNEVFDDYSKIRKIAHQLAENQDERAYNLFLEGLKSEYNDWRHDCIIFLGFHYIPLDKEVINNIISLFEEDSSEDIRVTIPFVLAANMDNYSKVLLDILKNDNNRNVRLSALENLLEFYGLPWIKRDLIIQDLQKKNKMPNIYLLENILIKNNITYSINDLSK